MLYDAVFIPSLIWLGFRLPRKQFDVRRVTSCYINSSRRGDANALRYLRTLNSESPVLQRPSTTPSLEMLVRTAFYAPFTLAEARCTIADPELVNDDHPSGKIWSVYVSEAEKEDKALAEGWKGDMEGLLNIRE